MKLNKIEQRQVYFSKVNMLILDRFGIPLEILKTSTRSQEVVQAKFIAWYILRKHYLISFPVIGAYYDKDHTTIMNGVRVVENSWPLIQTASNMIMDLED